MVGKNDIHKLFDRDDDDSECYWLILLAATFSAGQLV